MHGPLSPNSLQNENLWLRGLVPGNTYKKSAKRKQIPENRVITGFGPNGEPPDTKTPAALSSAGRDARLWGFQPLKL